MTPAHAAPGHSHPRARGVLHVLLATLLAVGLGVLAPLTARAAVQPAPFTDDDFSLVDAQSANMGAYTSDYNGFAADPTVITRSDTEPGWLTYATDADITSVSINSYIWVHTSSPTLTVQTSADGQTWTPLAVSVSQRPNTVASDWPLTVHEAQVATPGQRHLRIELGGSADGGGWGVQVARVHVNSRVLQVTAQPTAPSRVDGPTDITLATPTPDAQIYYTLDDGAEQLYTAPITIDGKASITAVGRAAGLADSSPVTFNYSSAGDVMVDRYGQMEDYDWPTKVTSDEELRADIAADEAYYASFNPPERDTYGGDPGSGARLGLDATGYFHVGTTNDGRTTLVTPEGNQYFSLGLNVFGSVGDTYTQVAGREQVYEYLPTSADDPLNAGWMGGSVGQNYSFYVANQVRKYGSWNPAEYWARQVDRVSGMCFNTVGGFSSIAQRANAPMPYVAHLDDAVPNHEIGWSGLYDVFAPGLDAELNQAMASAVEQYRDDPYLVGYMFFNEINWARLRTAVTEQPASEVASKGVLVDLLAERHGTIESFNAAWGMDAASFDALRELSFTPRTEEAVADIDAFSERYLDRFYQVFSDAIRAADPHHLVMGDRWFGSVIANDKLRDQLATAAGKYLDVLTYNYYTWDLNPDRIDAIYEKSGGTPMILTEFHYGEPTRGLTFAIRMAQDEQEKGLLYRNYVEQAAASGKIVGTHWFEYLDQAPTGRWFEGLDGEAGGIGLIDVTDRPYKTLQADVAQSNCGIYDVAEGTRAPYAYDFKPGQVERQNNKVTDIPRVTTPITIDGVRDETWPEGETLHLTTPDLTDGIALDGVSADFRLAWDAEFLYVHALIADPTPMLNPNTGFDTWNGDVVELFVGPRNVDSGGGIQITDTQIIFNGQPQDASCTLDYHWYNERTDQPAIEGKVVPAMGGYQLEAAVRLSDLGISAVTPPQTIRFDIGFADGNGRQRQRQYMWNGVEGNANNREAWGRAVLVDEAGATPSPTATPTPTPTVTPTATPPVTPTPSPSATPSKPGKPTAKPSKPGKPTAKPSQPGKPTAKPSKPGKPKPGKPSKPGKPGHPGKPGVPGRPHAV